jgi:hypothetical protein
MRIVTASLFLAQSLFLTVFASYPLLAEKACVKVASGKVVCGELVPKKPSSSNAPSPKEKITIKTQLGVDFTLNGCSKSRDGLICLINVYNSTDFDKRVIYGGYIDITDSEGNTYQTAEFSIGNRYQSETILPPKSNTKSQIFLRPNGLLNNYIRILKVQPRIDSQFVNIVFRDFNINQP